MSAVGNAPSIADQWAKHAVKPADPRMQVVLGLMPADAVFIVRRGYVVDADSDSPTHIDPLLWAPKSSGYVSADNPWQAGLYTEPTGYQPRGAEAEPHSYTVRASERLAGLRVQDDTLLALLADEIVRLRAALVERGHTDECYSGTVEECDCPLRVLGKLPKEQA